MTQSMPWKIVCASRGTQQKLKQSLEQSGFKNVAVMPEAYITMGIFKIPIGELMMPFGLLAFFVIYPEVPFSVFGDSVLVGLGMLLSSPAAANSRLLLISARVAGETGRKPVIVYGADYAFNFTLSDCLASIIPCKCAAAFSMS
jgi:hypothetical protein